MFRSSLAWIGLFGDVGEADPALTVFDVVKLHHDLLLGVSVRLDRLPEIDELIFVDLAVGVSVDLVEELFGRDPAKGTLPVVDGLCFVDLLAAVDIEDSKHLVDLIHALLAQGAITLHKTDEK